MHTAYISTVHLRTSILCVSEREGDVSPCSHACLHALTSSVVMHVSFSALEAVLYVRIWGASESPTFFGSFLVCIWESGGLLHGVFHRVDSWCDTDNPHLTFGIQLSLCFDFWEAQRSVLEPLWVLRWLKGCIRNKGFMTVSQHCL